MACAAVADELDVFACVAAAVNQPFFFATLQDVKMKERRIEPNECKRAAANHMLVMRTVDLVNLYELVTQGQLELSRFLEMLLSESGWLKVESSGCKVIKE